MWLDSLPSNYEPDNNTPCLKFLSVCACVCGVSVCVCMIFSVCVHASVCACVSVCSNIADPANGS